MTLVQTGVLRHRDLDASRLALADVVDSVRSHLTNNNLPNWNITGHAHNCKAARHKNLNGPTVHSEPCRCFLPSACCTPNRLHVPHRRLFSEGSAVLDHDKASTRAREAAAGQQNPLPRLSLHRGRRPAHHRRSHDYRRHHPPPNLVQLPQTVSISIVAKVRRQAFTIGRGKMPKINAFPSTSSLPHNSSRGQHWQFPPPAHAVRQHSLAITCKAVRKLHQVQPHGHHHPGSHGPPPPESTTTATTRTVHTTVPGPNPSHSIGQLKTCLCHMTRSHPAQGD